MENIFCLLSRRAVVYGLTNRNLSLPRLWTLYWKQGLTLLPAKDINLQPSLQLQTQTDPKYRKEIAKLNAEVMGSNTDPYYGAPVVILVLADGSASTFVEDGSCVLENMMLAAHALGLGTVWVHREREIFDSESGKALLREWKLPETLRGVGALHWVIRPRKPVSPQHANKTILFGFNVPLSGAIFLHRTICGEEGKYADQ